MTKREIYLEGLLKKAIEHNGKLEAILKDIVSPFGSVNYKVVDRPGLEWEETHLFNESRLYRVLGKDDARTVLSIWRRFREICEVLQSTGEV